VLTAWLGARCIKRGLSLDVPTGVLEGTTAREEMRAAQRTHTNDAEWQRHKPHEWRKNQYQDGNRPRDDQQDAPGYEEDQDFHDHLSAEVNFCGKGA
jgi:hypothetical protein